MSARKLPDPILSGARCPCRVHYGLPCPGRLTPVDDAWPIAVAAPRLRCNGPDAHEVEVGAANSRRDDAARSRVA